MQVTCLNCGKTLRTRDEFAGKMGQCPSCKTKVRLPGRPVGGPLMQARRVPAAPARVAVAVAAPVRISRAPLASERVLTSARARETTVVLERANPASVRAPRAMSETTVVLEPASVASMPAPRAMSETTVVLEPAGAASMPAPHATFDPEIRSEDLRSKYWWLYVPMFSWTLLVFPLILPPIPLGPILISLAWNRREWMSHINRSMRLLGKTRTPHEFPMGWMVNVFVNLGDLFTGGLSHLFVTASLLNSLDKRFGKQPDEPDALGWVFKWLFLGNVVFLAVYMACPGIIFEPLLSRIERHLRRGVPTLASAETGGALTPRSRVELPASA